MLKYQTQLCLLEAAGDDTSSMLTQIEEWKSFLAHVATLSWKGPSSMTHDRVDRNTQIHATKASVAEFAKKHARQEVSEENNNKQLFVQDSVTRHRPSERKSIEGTFANKKVKKGRVKVYRNIHVSLGTQLKGAKSIIAEENADVPIDSFAICGQELHEGNFLEAVVLPGLGVRKCHRCKGEISKRSAYP